METALLPDETLQKTGFANLQRGWEAVGGRLALTDRRLIFESHPFNIQSGKTVIPLPTIADVKECWTKLLNLFPLVPNSIAVTTKDGHEYHIVVYSRKDWIDAIMKQVALQG